MPTPEAINCDIDAITAHREPDFLSTVLGEDRLSPTFAPHKALRLAVCALLVGIIVRRCVVSLTLLALGFLLIWMPSTTLLRMLIILAGAITVTIASERYFRSRLLERIKRVCLFWERYKHRTELSTFELARIAHVFNSRIWLATIGDVSLKVAYLVGCYFIFRFKGIGWSICAVLLGIVVWFDGRKGAYRLIHAVFSACTEQPVAIVANEANAASEAGLLPGDMSLRSSSRTNKRSGRRLRLPSMTGSTALAYTSAATYIFGAMFIFFPVAWFTYGHWPQYLPLSQISVLLIMWIIHHTIRAIKASDKRQFQTALFRRFLTNPSSVAKKAIMPVLGAVGSAVTIEDGDFRRAEVTAVPFAVDVSAVIGRDHIPYVEDSNWPSKISSLIEVSDAAVIDITDLNPSVIWELDECLAQLPPDRVLLVGDLDAVTKTTLHDHKLVSPLREFPLDELRMIGYEEGMLGRMVLKWKLLNEFRAMKNRA